MAALPLPVMFPSNAAVPIALLAPPVMLPRIAPSSASQPVAVLDLPVLRPSALVPNAV